MLLHSAVDEFAEIADSLVVSKPAGFSNSQVTISELFVQVGQKQGDDERVVCFIKMTEGNAFTKELVESIKSTIRSRLSARYVSHVKAFCRCSSS